MADYRIVSEEEKGIKIISFEEWNKQFADNENLDDFIPEYGTTLGEFRKAIYEAETDSNHMSIEVFRQRIKTW